MQPIAPFGMTPPPVGGPIFGLDMGPPPAQSMNFQDALLQSLVQVQSINAHAQTSIAHSLAGNDLTMIESFTAVREADLALRMMIQIRNKLLDAYQEIQNLRM